VIFAALSTAGASAAPCEEKETMTTRSDLKQIIRARQHKTGESYTSARAHVMRDRAALLGLEPAGEPSAAPTPEQVDALVLKVNAQSARVRIPGEPAEVTFRGDVWDLAPGHVVTLQIARRWIWRGAPYASGAAENPRMDVSRLALTPLPLADHGAIDLREVTEPFKDPEPYATLWRQLTAKPRVEFEMDRIAWGDFSVPGQEDCPVSDAGELMRVGDRDGARDLLMDTLHRDLRCIDAHAHLGNLVFDRSPKRAVIHYEIGARIGNLSFPPGFNGYFLWGSIYNRPFLRCLHGHGLCLWRLGRPAEARAVFERILSLNPSDNQGVRICHQYVLDGRSWEEMQRDEAAGGV
jgi:hypothetical protein